MAAETQNVYFNSSVWIFVFKNQSAFDINSIYVCKILHGIWRDTCSTKRRRRKQFTVTKQKKKRNRKVAIFCQNENSKKRETVSMTKRCEDYLNWDLNLDTFLKKIQG